MIKSVTRRSALKICAILGGLGLLTAMQDAPVGADAAASGAASLEQAVARYDEAWNARDATALNQLLAPDYVYFTSRGAVWSRTRWLEFMLSPKYVLNAAKRSEIAIHQTGDAAVVSTRWIGNGSYDGRVFDDDQRCSIGLARTGGTWRILSEHCTQITPR
jgi:ketosteroid isomerase-like protein